MKAVKQVALHPMVAKVAHPQTTPQAKQVKGQEMVKEHRQMVKVDKAMAILKAVKVKVIPIVVRVKVMVIAEIPKRKAKAVLMAQVKVKEMAMVAVKKEIATIVVVNPTAMAEMMPMAIVGKMATHPKVARAKKVLKKEIPTPILKVMAIPTPIMRVEIPPIPIQMGKQPIQTLTKTVKKATKVEILPKRVILTMTRLQQTVIPKAEIRAMKAVIPIVPAYLPKMKKPSIS